MDGFLPLIEGFLAFALTMLALTTAVSAIVGVLHRLRRRRAQGLRDMVRMLYLTEIRDLLPESYFQQLRQKKSARDAVVKKRRWSGFELKHDHAIDGRLEGRAEFISDMTLMPLPTVVNGLDVDKDYWKVRLESAERLAGRPWTVKLKHPVRWLRRWRTLRYGLETLTDDEFQQRLADSDACRSIREAGSFGGRASWEELESHLLKKFQTIGAASSETFARCSRVRSVVVGFLLAFAINVDSIDLLNSYLTDPQLRADVLAQSEDILSPDQQDAVPAEGGKGKGVLSEKRQRLTESTRQLTANAEDLLARVKTLATELGEDQAADLVAELEDRLGTMGQQVTEVESGLGELDLEVTAARDRVQGTVRALTASFPVGWTRFPNCTATSPDLRCAGKDFVGQGRARAEKKAEARTAAMAALGKVAQVKVTQLAVGLETLAVASGEARADFSQWLAGVLLTGLLLGLGTPFWIQVVNASLKLRRWVSDKGDTQEGAGSTGPRTTPGAVPPTPEPGGRRDSQ